MKQLTDIMCSELVLALPNFELNFKVTIDASELGYGAVLEQEVSEVDRSIGYLSKCYTISQKELFEFRERITWNRHGSRTLVILPLW